MSGELNRIIESFRNYKTSHILGAFEFGDGASNSRISDAKVRPGDSLPSGCGGAVCVVNDAEHPFYTITNLIWSYEYSNNYEKSSTFCHGSMMLADTAGSSFSDFVKKNVCDVLNTSIGNLTFNLTTTITGVNADEQEETVQLKPLIFKITDISSTNSASGRLYTIYFTLDYNSTIFNPNLSKFSRVTVSTSEGDPANVSDFIGSSAASSSYGSREAANRPIRDNRSNNVRPMINLDDLTKSINNSLNQNVEPTKQVIQTILSSYNDSHGGKVETKDTTPIPIEYEIDLDEKYKTSVIDNRNLIFEQIKLDQETPGISSVSFPDEIWLNDIYEECLKMSSALGEDAKKGFTYRLATTTFRDCSNKIKNKTFIKRIEQPHNESGVKDTGVGAEGNIDPLTYDFQKEQLSDVKIFGLNSTNMPAFSFDFNENTKSNPNSAVYQGDREYTQYTRTFENRDFFLAKSSGLRVSSNKLNSGLEKPEDAAAFDYLEFRGKKEQTSTITISTRGNPDLYNDLARSPLAVYGKNPDGATHYQFPELLPMYARVKIDIKSDTDRDKVENSDPMLIEQRLFYYDGFFHIVSVVNHINASTFTQKLILARTDDIF